MVPLQIKIKEKKYLYIKWENNSESLIKLANLRRACPCALCQEEKSKQGHRYIPIYNDDQLTIANIRIMGYYAINVTWKDGHSTGIYEFERLISLSENNADGMVA